MTHYRTVRVGDRLPDLETMVNPYHFIIDGEILRIQYSKHRNNVYFLRNELINTGCRRDCVEVEHDISIDEFIEKFPQAEWLEPYEPEPKIITDGLINTVALAISDCLGDCFIDHYIDQAEAALLALGYKEE